MRNLIGIVGVAFVLAVGAALAAAGDLDGSFGSGGVVLTDLGSSSDDVAHGVVIQESGKVVAAGTSDAGGNADFALARYTKAGALDQGFGCPAPPCDGYVLSDLGASTLDIALGLALQSDAKLLAVGFGGTTGPTADAVLARYTKNGVLDSSFGCPASPCSGFVAHDVGSSSDDEYSTVALQKDGKIVVAGFTTADGSVDFLVARYTKKGVPDTTFGCPSPPCSGEVLTDLGSASNDQAYGVAVQGDGKIVVAGVSDANGTDDFAVARYTKKGVLDTSFGCSSGPCTGIVLTDIGSSSSDTGHALALQPGGKIVVAGSTNSSGGDFALVRYTSSGVVDTGFGCATPPCSGKVVTDVGTATHDAILGMALQRDGRIVVGGRSSGDFAVATYKKSGVLDTSFGSGGKAVDDLGSSSSDQIESVAIASEGKVVAAGKSNANGSNDFALTRYLAH